MEPFEWLATPRMQIRRLAIADKEKLIELLCNRSITQYMAFPEELLTTEGVTNLLEMTINAYDTPKPLLSFAIVEKNSSALIGVTGFTPLKNKELEVFCAFLPDCWGKGLATELLTSLTE